MQLLLAGAVATLAASVVLRFLDIWFEGRGSRVRRGITADLALLESLDASSVTAEKVRTELRARIALEVLAFSMGDLPRAKHADVQRRSGRMVLLFALIIGALTFSLAWGAGKSTGDMSTLGVEQEWQPLMAVLSLLSGLGSAYLLTQSARSYATRVVRREYAAELVDALDSPVA